MTNLSTVADWGSGGTPKTGTREYYSGSIPWAVIGDLKDGKVTSTTTSITESGLSNSSAKIVEPGVVLIAMYGASIGKLGLPAVPMATNQAIAFARPRDGVLDRDYLFYYLMRARDDLVAAGKGAAQPNISQTILKEWPIPLAPLAEQQRIVEAIEEQLSRVDAGVAALESGRTRAASLLKAVLLAAVPDNAPPHWTRVTVGEAGEVRLGRQRSPRFHHGPNMRPYLRVANVFEDRINTSDVMTMHFSDEEFARYRLEPGDILLNEGQSPHLLGRPAMYRGDPPNVAYTNSLLRFRANEGVLPEWALLVFRRHLHAKRFMRESNITTNIAHLSAGRFKSIEFPVPSVAEQRRILASVDEALSILAVTSATLDQQRVRATTLRRAILAAAFSGELTAKSPEDEPASVLLEQIARDRVAFNGHRPSIEASPTKASA